MGRKVQFESIGLVDIGQLADIQANRLGIDDNTGFIIRDGIGEVSGHGRIAIYDNKKYKAGWYYWLKPGDKFDFGKKLPMNFSPK